MDKVEILAKLKSVVTAYAQDKEALENLHDDTDFIKDLKINSANLVDIVLDVEEEFGIEIDNESMEKMLTIKASVEIIEQKLSAK